MRKIFIFVLFVLFTTNAWAFALKSRAFKDGEDIDPKYTFYGENISPDLYWEDVPPSTECFAIVCEDPDAPNGIFTHWVIFNIPNALNGLEENVPKVSVLDNGAIQLNNDFGKVGYAGPYPPPGKAHRYIFTIYALEVMLTEFEGSSKEEVMYSIRRHSLGEARIIGIDQR